MRSYMFTIIPNYIYENITNLYYLLFIHFICFIYIYPQHYYYTYTSLLFVLIYLNII